MTTSRLLAGASGYSFKEWKGTFYPQDIKPEAMLPWYSERLPTVEINNTFYRMPKITVLENWAADDARRLPVLDQGVAADHAHVAPQGGVGNRAARVSLPQSGGARRQARPGVVPAAAQSEEGPAAPRGIPRRCCPKITTPRSNFATTRGLPTTSTTRSKAPARRCACPSARTTRRRRWSRRRRGVMSGCASRTTPTTISKQWARKLEATSWREIFVYFMHEPTAPAYARKLMELRSQAQAMSANPKPVTIAVDDDERVSGLLQRHRTRAPATSWRTAPARAWRIRSWRASRTISPSTASPRFAISFRTWSAARSVRTLPAVAHATVRAAVAAASRLMPGRRLVRRRQVVWRPHDVASAGRVAVARSPRSRVRRIPAASARSAFRRARRASCQGANSDAVPAGHA